jgi:hypothetical protein
MPDKAHEFLFQRIKELLPTRISLADAVGERLNISSDSAYRRIRGETPLVLEEVNELCKFYRISLDQLLEINNDTVPFQDIRVNLENYNYELYLKDIRTRLEQIGDFAHKEIIYLSKDVPVFHNFYYKPLIAFRYFFWMKTILQNPEFANKKFDLNCVSPEIVSQSQGLSKLYNTIPSSEIWNTECFNSVISQVEFYKDSGYFSSVADVRTIYESLEATILHLKEEAAHGCKFMPGEKPETKKNNFKIYYNQLVLGDNTIMVITDMTKMVFLNYEILNYMFTRDEKFCSSCYHYLQNQMKRATLMSQTSERERNMFFSNLLNRVSDQLKKL